MFPDNRFIKKKMSQIQLNAQNNIIEACHTQKSNQRQPVQSKHKKG